MKSITFKRGRNMRYFTYVFGDVYSDIPTYLDELAGSGLIFRMLLFTERFSCVVGKNKITGYTDKYGNKILHFYE